MGADDGRVKEAIALSNWHYSPLLLEQPLEQILASWSGFQPETPCPLSSSVRMKKPQDHWGFFIFALVGDTGLGPVTSRV